MEMRAPRSSQNSSVSCAAFNAGLPERRLTVRPSRLTLSQTPLARPALSLRPNEPLRGHVYRLGVKRFPALQYRPGDPRQLVGQGDGRDIAMGPPHQLFRPSAERRVTLRDMGQRGARPVDQLFAQKMHGMAQAVGELTEQGSPAFQAAVPILSQLLKAETADREVRSTAYQLKAARFPNYRDLTAFDFASSEVNEALVRQLHRCEFLEDVHNVVLVGGPGTGKTHLATAIGVQAIEHHRKRVRFFSTVELVNALEQEKLQGKPGQIAARLTHSDLVILDELGYLPFSASGGALLFHLLSKLY